MHDTQSAAIDDDQFLRIVRFGIVIGHVTPSLS